MKKILFAVAIVYAAAAWAGAANLVINPANDGYISSDFGGSVSTSGYVMVTYYYHGVVVFGTNQISGQIADASLCITPYATPVWITHLAVYGYQGNDSQIRVSDYDAGVFLGNWDLGNQDFGDRFFDVTQFMQGASSSFVTFNLHPVPPVSGADVFSSLEDHYGHASQLAITYTPEPATMLLLGLGGVILGRKQS